MRKILWILTMLSIIQGVYAMNEDDRVSFEIQRIKVQQSLFDNKSLEEQQETLVSAFNLYHATKQSAQFYICVKLGRPATEYEGFDPTEESFTLNTPLQFSGKILPIKDIRGEDLNPLINHLLKKSAIFSFKKKLSRNSNVISFHDSYEEAFKKNRHTLLLDTFKVISEYEIIKEAFKNYVKEEISKYSILKEALKKHTMAEKTAAFHEGMLECRLLHKDYTTNKEETDQELLEKNEEFQKVLNKEKKIKNLFKNSEALNLWCRKRATINSPNKLCNPKCVLKAFVDFSIEDLFKFYDLRCNKFYELSKINEAYVTRYALLNMPYLQENTSYTTEEQTFFNTQEKTSYNAQVKACNPIILLSGQTSTPIQERLRKKLQSQQEKVEEEKNKPIMKPEESCNKEIKKEPLITPSVDEILHNILGEDALRDGYKKPYNQKKSKKGGGQEEKPNLKKPASGRQQPQKKETAPQKQPIPPSPIMVNMKGGGTAVRGVSIPHDGQEEGFKSQSVKKSRKEEYAPSKEIRKPTPKRKPQNKARTKDQHTDSFLSSKPDLPENPPHTVVITPPTFPSKDRLYAQVLQNVTLPESEPLLDSREAPEEKDLPTREENGNGDKKIKNIYQPIIPSEEERNSENPKSENSIGSNKDLPTSSEQSPPQIKPDLIETQESEVQNGRAPMDQPATPVLKQPLSPVIFPSNEYKVQDHPTIAKILIQNKIAHVYTHEREEAEGVVTRYRAALESEKRAREACDEEIAELKQKIASLIK